MRNNWYDVLVINICLLAYSHWLSDHEKKIYDKRKKKLRLWTLVPEIIGITASLAGIYLQDNTDGAFYRSMDYGELISNFLTQNRFLMQFIIYTRLRE